MVLSKKKIIVAGVVVLALLVAGVGGAVVLAQGPTSNPPQNGKTGFTQLYLQALANRLGTTTDKLQQAMTDARKDATNNAVKQGLITQAQADKMTQNAGKGLFPALRDRLTNAAKQIGRRGFALGARFGVTRGLVGEDALESVAKVLNMTPADVTSALRGGKTLADLAQSQKVDPSKVQQAIADAEKSAIDRALKDGLITQDRANTLKAKIDPSKIDLSRPLLGLLDKSGARPTSKP
ncbi:MAG: hypothetical protein KGJ80_01790 [Chloroflexota bacterium]|nr:hypothetical protein [Chloroflexota bacterium]